jgi:hypothetical protein
MPRNVMHALTVGIVFAVLILGGSVSARGGAMLTLSRGNETATEHRQPSGLPMKSQTPPSEANVVPFGGAREGHEHPEEMESEGANPEPAETPPTADEVAP